MNWYPHFLVHGAIGAAVMCSLAAISRLNRKDRWRIACVSFVIGVLPDIPIPAWYASAHTGLLAYLFMWVPPWGLHVLYDILLHKVGDWWSTYWWLEISLWILSLTALWYYLIRSGRRKASVRLMPAVAGVPRSRQSTDTATKMRHVSTI